MMITAQKEGVLIDFLTLLSPLSSKTTLRSWVKEGRILVNGALANRADMPIFPGQKIELGKKIELIGNRLRVVYQDSHLIAIEKPAGLLSVSTAFQKTDTAHAMLKRHFSPRKIFVVHRLDQDTSGVMLFALSDEGYRGLKRCFAAHDIERTYIAIVEGKPDKEKGTWESYLAEDPLYRVYSTSDPNEGELAITHYEVIGETATNARLKLKLETGKKNQIRVHCQDHGTPIVGDKKYGAVTDPLNRLCLHAAFLGLDHPITSKPLKFVSPPPLGFDRLAPEMKR